jgi:hypothetical protein
MAVARKLLQDRMPITKKELDALGSGTLIWDSGRGSVSGFGARRQKSAKVSS